MEKCKKEGIPINHWAVEGGWNHLRGILREILVEGSDNRETGKMDDDVSTKQWENVSKSDWDSAGLLRQHCHICPPLSVVHPRTTQGRLPPKRKLCTTWFTTQQCARRYNGWPGKCPLSLVWRHNSFRRCRRWVLLVWTHLPSWSLHHQYWGQHMSDVLVGIVSRGGSLLVGYSVEYV